MSKVNGIVELDELIKKMTPELELDEYVFCSFSGDLSINERDLFSLQPIASFRETEGLTLVLDRLVADKKGFPYCGVFNLITLKVHSSLQAVGLTAAVSSALAQEGISANVIAAYYHDHIFVPTEHAKRACRVLKSLSATE